MWNRIREKLASALEVVINMLGTMVIPVKKNTVFFVSFSGQYNDNPKYISRILHETHPELKQFWMRSARGHERFPSYVTTVQTKLQIWFYRNRAQVVVDGHDGVRKINMPKGPFKAFVRLACRKRKNQYCISTWHGTPLKHIGRDMPEFRTLEWATCSDYSIAGNRYTQRILQTALFDAATPVKLYGTPRNDILFGTPDIDAIKWKLKLPRDRKIVMFAPTFRDDGDIGGVQQLNSLDFDRLFSALERKFGGKWSFVLRIHSNVLLRVDMAALTQKFGDRIINGNYGDDMAEYLVCTDVLITDYSSSMFDFALTGRPCFLYMLDLDHYGSVERGFYLDHNVLPFPIAQDEAQLLQSIETFDQGRYGQRVDRFLDEIGNVEDGLAAKRITDDIAHFIETGEKLSGSESEDKSDGH